jgi:hypothetical protein
MSRRAVLKVVKTNYTPSAPWMVRVPPRLHSIEGARKKFFAKESIAKAYVERLAKQLGDYHSQALGLSDRNKLEASECYRLLQGHNASLLDAVHHYLTYLDQTKKSIPVSELFDEFLSVKRQDNVSPKYLADLRSKLGRFVSSFHDTLVCDLTVAQIEPWIRSLAIGNRLSRVVPTQYKRIARIRPSPRISSRQSCGGHQNSAAPRGGGIDSYAGRIAQSIEQMRAGDCAVRCDLRVRRFAPV